MTDSSVPYTPSPNKANDQVATSLDSPSKRNLDLFLKAVKNDLPLTPSPKRVSLPRSSSSQSIKEKMPLAYEFMLRKRASSVSSENPKNSTPSSPSSYTPWSRESFLKRLSTFTYKSWDIPPDIKDINSVQCSKQGWSCIKSDTKNTIQCIYCHKLLNIQLGYNPDIMPILRDKYKEMLVTHHIESCPWKKRWCNDDIYELSSAVSIQKPLITERYNTLIVIKDFLKNCNLEYEPKLDEFEIESEFKSSTSFLEIYDVDKTCLIVALLGWKRLSSADCKPQILGCDLCFRRIVIRDTNSEATNLNDEHEIFCPYIQKDKEGNLKWIEIYNLINATKIKASRLNPGVDEDDKTYKQRKERLTKLRQVYLSR